MMSVGSDSRVILLDSILLDEKTPNSNYLLPSESIIKRSDSNIQYDNLCVLTGPSHAEELINEKATAILAASTNIEFAK